MPEPLTQNRHSTGLGGSLHYAADRPYCVRSMTLRIVPIVEVVRVSSSSPYEEPDPISVEPVKGERGDDSVPYNWREDALCHGMDSLFDLEDTLHVSNARKKFAHAVNRNRAQKAALVCHDCPVYSECWEDAVTSVPIPLGVIRAGARLSSPFWKVRERMLLLANIDHQHHIAEDEV